MIASIAVSHYSYSITAYSITTAYIQNTVH